MFLIKKKIKLFKKKKKKKKIADVNEAKKKKCEFLKKFDRIKGHFVIANIFDLPLVLWKD